MITNRQLAAARVRAARAKYREAIATLEENFPSEVAEIGRPDAAFFFAENKKKAHEKCASTIKQILVSTPCPA